MQLTCRYCDYEWKLEQLRQLRRKKREISGKRSLADYGIVRRIHFIYDRATRKFKGDVAIWMSWLQFCKESNSKRQVSKVVTKALKLHPCAPYFWAYAAAWCVPIDPFDLALHSVARSCGHPTLHQCDRTEKEAGFA